MEKDERKIILVDAETGEKIGDYRPKKAKERNYHYVLTFYSAYSKITEDVKMLIAGQMDVKNRVVLDKDKIEIMSRNYKITEWAIRAVVQRMLKAGLMQRITPTLYFINPYYFTKTNLNRVEELRKEYSELVFSIGKKEKKLTIEQKEQVRQKGLEKQIKDIMGEC